MERSGSKGAITKSGMLTLLTSLSLPFGNCSAEDVTRSLIKIPVKRTDRQNT
jgi:hypothetical protein